MRTERLMLSILARAFACPKGQALPQLKSHSLANLYKYLTSKSLEISPQSQRPLQTLRLLGQALRWDPSLLRKPVMGKIALKVLAAILVPHPWRAALLQNSRAGQIPQHC
ncbi:MAG: hypothetical protein HC771_20145 [Synechococcales cyanobacterium CRU_2_2]|nr:hypothetical protein [Synechococcales cyanobacterium CRU_2_2]